jgi:hypothetical protein
MQTTNGTFPRSVRKPYVSELLLKPIAVAELRTLTPGSQPTGCWIRCKSLTTPQSGRSTRDRPAKPLYLIPRTNGDQAKVGIRDGQSPEFAPCPGCLPTISGCQMQHARRAFGRLGGRNGWRKIGILFPGKRWRL